MGSFGDKSRGASSSSSSSSSKRNLTRVPSSLQSSSKKHVYHCPFEGCNSESNRKYNMRVHMRKHTGETPYNCRFAGCGKSFPWKSSCDNHEKKHLEENEQRALAEGSQVAEGSQGPMEEEFGDRVDVPSIVRAPPTRGTAVRTNADEAPRQRPTREMKIPVQQPRQSPLDVPLFEVGELDNILSEPLDDSSHNSLLSINLSHEDFSSLSDLNQRLSNSDRLECEDLSSHTLPWMLEL